MKNASQANRDRGFTLTEAAVVTALVAVLFAAATPKMSDLVMDSRIKQASVEMFTSMTYARSEAITRDAPVSISAVGSWSDGWQITVGNTVLKRSDPISNVVITGPASNSLTYNPNGRLSSAGLVTFSFTAGGTSNATKRCVVSTLSGQPLLQADRNRDGDCSNG